MLQLATAIPDPAALLALEPEELGAKLLFLLRQRFGDVGRSGDRMFHGGNLLNELSASLRDDPPYPRETMSDISLAFVEAWAWLEAQGLIVRAPDINGNNGFMVLSRRARKFQDEGDLGTFAAAHQLRKELLHASIARPVWLAFIRGEFATAVFQAMRAVEIAVRDAAGYADSELGVTLMRKAFDVKAGPLTDRSADKGEREALQHLFAGAIGSYKNPHSHRNVPIEDPGEAIEIIMLASHLLRIVDDRAKRFGKAVIVVPGSGGATPGR